jgi:hypothetical protein
MFEVYVSFHLRLERSPQFFETASGPNAVVPRLLACPSMVCNYPPSLSELGERLEYNSQRCGVLRRVARAFLAAETRCALATQSTRSLSGDLEVDGTSIKKWHPVGSTTNYYQQVFGVTCRAQENQPSRIWYRAGSQLRQAPSRISGEVGIFRCCKVH